MLGTFRQHTPPDTILRNSNVDKLLKVLDGMLDTKNEAIETYTNSFDPRLVADLRILRLYVDSFEGEYLDSFLRPQLECLILNKWDIMELKGTRAGIKLWIECITGGTVTDITPESPFPLIHFQNLESGVLPNDSDIKLEIDDPFSTPYYVATLLGGEGWEFYSTTLSITISGSVDTSTEFIEFVRATLPLYLTFYDPNTTIILNFI